MRIVVDLNPSMDDFGQREPSAHLIGQRVSVAFPQASGMLSAEHLNTQGFLVDEARVDVEFLALDTSRVGTRSSSTRTHQLIEDGHRVGVFL